MSALKTAEQLELEIADARSGRDGMPQTADQCIDYIVRLYGAEFEKANERIRKLTGILELCKIGSCNCLTKTPEVKHHLVTCHYRKICEAIKP